MGTPFGNVNALTGKGEVFGPSPDSEISTLDRTLQQRGDRYGTFEENAQVAQALKDVVRCSSNWKTMASDQREAVDMVLSKISRLTTGDPDYLDNWHDIAGYAQLIETRLKVCAA